MMTRNEQITLLGLLQLFRHHQPTPQAAAETTDRNNVAVVLSEYIKRDLAATAPKARGN